MVITVVVAAVTVASLIGALVAASSWAMSARVLIEAYFSFFDVGVLVGGRNHLANPHGRLAVELEAEVTVMESTDKAVMTSASVVLGIEFLILGKRLMWLRRSSDSFW